MSLGILTHILLIGIAMQSFYFNPPFTSPAGVKGKPFQAQYEQNQSQKLPGGQISHQAKTGMIYRAADGRSRRETFLEVSPNMIKSEAIIHNPLVQKVYFLDTESRSVITVPLGETEDEMDEHSGTLTQPQAFMGDDLGQKIIEGLVCRGYRLTQTDGRIIEYWVSQDLSEILLAKSLFAEEEITLRLFDIRRNEPDNNLFTVPADYEEEIMDSDE